jgi:hypothetical protein
LDGAPSALSSLIPTAAGCCSPDSGTDSCRDSRSGTTSPRLTEIRGEDGSMWSAGDFLAKTYQSPTPRGGASTESEADCGPKWQGSLARFDRVSRSWKTRQQLLTGGLAEFSETWPRWGMMRDGECWAQDISALGICVKDSGWWLPTIAANEGKGSSRKRYRGSADFRGAKMSEGLRTSFDCPNYLNPSFGEMAMGYPEEWTNGFAPLATHKFQQWCERHGFTWGAHDED